MQEVAERTLLKQRLNLKTLFGETELQKVFGAKLINSPRAQAIIHMDTWGSLGNSTLGDRQPLSLTNLLGFEEGFADFCNLSQEMTTYDSEGKIKRDGRENPWLQRIGIDLLELLHHRMARSVTRGETKPTVIIPTDVVNQPQMPNLSEKPKAATEPIP